MNKKILAVLMALMMVLTSVAAFAEGGLDESFKNNNGSNNFKIVKKYTTNDVSTTFVPEETLKFEAAFDDFEAMDSSVTTEPTTAPEFTGSLDVTAAGEYNVTISGVGDYAVAGKYFYTLKEEVGETKTQGVDYAKNGTEKISFVVTVGYAEDGTLAILDVGVVKVGDEKNGTITNSYSVGGVTINKVVTGNAANLTDEFDAEVVITPASDDVVLPKSFTVHYTELGVSKTATLTAENGYKFNTVLKNGTDNNIKITNLPEGALVTVTETDALVDSDGKDVTKYSVNYKDNGAAAAANAPTIVVTNARNTEIDTGVTTDSMPYIMLMAFVMILAAAVVLKKRSVNE